MTRKEQARAHLNPRRQVVRQDKLEEWRAFRHQWTDCHICSLSLNRERIVHFRGIIPADVLFIGEAPGTSEDEIGLPFVGPAGTLLDDMIAEAGLQDGDFCIINTVACVPKDTEGKLRVPEPAEIKACRPRFEQLLQMISPRLIVLLGRIAAGVQIRVEQPIIELLHPAAILRKATADQALMKRRFILTLQQAFEQLNSIPE